MLKIGDQVPEFSFTSEAFGAVSSGALRGKRFVMYFYPKDDTPGCTREACAFRDNLPKFAGLGIKVFGISADDEKSHIRFSRKHTLPFKLIPDPDHVICEAFGTWIEKSMYGRVYMGVARNTYVIGSDGKIAKIWEKVVPDGHAEEVYAWLNGDPVPTAAKPKSLGTDAALNRTSKVTSKSASPVATKAPPITPAPVTLAVSQKTKPSTAVKPTAPITKPAAVKAKSTAVAKSLVQKPVVKVAVAKKPAAKAAVTKKPTAKQSIAKKAVAKKAVAKKPMVKAAIKKMAAKQKPVVLKSAARKPAAKPPLKHKHPAATKAKPAAKPTTRKQKPGAAKKPSPKPGKSRR